MNLSEKIEEIKRKPEHVRLRYVWFFVSVSMVVVISIWILSIKADVGNVNSEISEMRSTNDLDDVSKKIGEQKEMLQSAFESSKEMANDVMKENESLDVNKDNTEKESIDNSEKSEISSGISDTSTASKEMAVPNAFPTD